MINEPELENFLSKIDEIEKVVKGLNSCDDKQVSENLKKADHLIEKYDTEVDGIKTKTVKSRTVINKDDSPPKNKECVAQNQDAFLKAMELDAEERYKRKQENLRLSNELKEKGNVEYQNKNYEKAIEFYSEAIQKAKDNIAVYTNRAQAYTKLEKYKEAINDCDWALRINEKCVKAMIHKGKALAFLKEFDKSKHEFDTAKEIDPKQTNRIDDYIKELERLKLSDRQEKAAECFLETLKSNNSNPTSPNLIDIMNKILNSKEQNVLYYSGGLRYLASLLDNETKRTLFRTQNGFKLFETDQILGKYFGKKSLNELNPFEIDLIQSALELISIVCLDCDENIRCLFQIDIFRLWLDSILDELLKLPESEVPKPTILNLLYQFVKSEFGLKQLLSNIDSAKLSSQLVQIALDDKSLNIKEKSVLIVENLSLETKFHSILKKDGLISLVTNLCKLLMPKEFESKKNLSIIILTTTYALTSTKPYRELIISLEPVWRQTIDVLKRVSSNDETSLNLVFSLLINLTTSKSESIDKFSIEISDCVLSHVKNPQALSLLGNLLQNIADRKSVLNRLFEKNLTEILFNNIKENIGISQSVKILAICAQNEPKYCDKIIELDKNMESLYGLFKDVSQKPIDTTTTTNLKKLPESLINNSILCMSQCVERNVSLGELLTKTNIVMDLLFLARDGFNLEMRKSCGILIAKLVKSDNRHLERLRELHGIEILYSSLKNADI